MTKKNHSIWLAALILLALGGAAILAGFRNDLVSNDFEMELPTKVVPSKDSTIIANDQVSLFAVEFPVFIPTVKYGFVLDEYATTAGNIRKHDIFSDILQQFGVSHLEIDRLVQATKDIYNVNKMRVGQPYLVLRSKEDSAKAEYFIYEPSAFSYVVYDFREGGTATMINRPVDTLQREIGAIVASSLWETFQNKNIANEIVVKMERAFAHTVNFHHIQPKDTFKLIYDEYFIEGNRVGTGNILAGFFKNSGKRNYIFYYEAKEHKGFFDAEGRAMKKAFLKAPVEYARISSAFNLRRFHPILKRVKAHLGTDYAAPYGTPILSVADGTVTKAEFGKGNGNYVKIRHDRVYETQYLHMQKFAKGIRPGAKVQQGQTIGYVGATGLATGPHVCFRFWKNGVQVDARKENLPRPQPMTGADFEAFKAYMDPLKERLDALDCSPKKETVTQNSTEVSTSDS